MPVLRNLQFCVERCMIFWTCEKIGGHVNLTWSHVRRTCRHFSLFLSINLSYMYRNTHHCYCVITFNVVTLPHLTTLACDGAKVKPWGWRRAHFTRNWFKVDFQLFPIVSTCSNETCSSYTSQCLVTVWSGKKTLVGQQDSGWMM